jgi:hypothetical protein
VVAFAFSALTTVAFRRKGGREGGREGEEGGRRRCNQCEVRFKAMDRTINTAGVHFGGLRGKTGHEKKKKRLA